MHKTDASRKKIKCDTKSKYVMVFVFFFKQMTAYEIRPRDWSSDVCSSDLPLMLTIQARNDWATHLTFPPTRVVATLGQSSGTDGYGAMVTALGHYPKFYTHDLS